MKKWEMAYVVREVLSKGRTNCQRYHPRGNFENTGGQFRIEELIRHYTQSTKQERI